MIFILCELPVIHIYIKNKRIVRTYIHIHLHTYINIYIHTHTYIYISRSSQRGNERGSNSQSLNEISSRRYLTLFHLSILSCPVGDRSVTSVGDPAWQLPAKKLRRKDKTYTHTHTIHTIYTHTHVYAHTIQHNVPLCVYKHVARVPKLATTKRWIFFLFSSYIYTYIGTFTLFLLSKDILSFFLSFLTIVSFLCLSFSLFFSLPLSLSYSFRNLMACIRSEKRANDE